MQTALEDGQTSAKAELHAATAALQRRLAVAEEDVAGLHARLAASDDDHDKCVHSFLRRFSSFISNLTKVT
jgi:hypothetical protein